VVHDYMKNLKIIIILIIVCVGGFFYFQGRQEKQKDLYIKMLIYGKENIGKSIKYSSLKKYLDNEGYEYEEFALRRFFGEVFVGKNAPYGNDPTKEPSGESEYFLEPRGYFYLLDFEALQEARQSSKIAVNFASAALVVSILTLLTSKGMSIKKNG